MTIWNAMGCGPLPRSVDVLPSGQSSRRKAARIRNREPLLFNTFFRMSPAFWFREVNCVRAFRRAKSPFH